MVENKGYGMTRADFFFVFVYTTATMLPEQKPPKDLGLQYVSPTGELPNRTLRLGEWYVMHKILLQHIGTGILIAWCVVTMGFSLYKWGEYLFIGMKQDDMLLLTQLRAENYQAMHPSYEARELSFGDVRVFRSAESVYTFSAGVTNPNARHLAYMQYKFVYASGETVATNAVILPGQTREIAVFGFSSTEYPADAHLVVESTRWRRVDPHRVADVGAFITERLKFIIDHFTFANPEGASVPSVTFDLTNDSAYSYWQPVFYVELYNGQELAGLAYVSIDRFLAGETRHIDVRLFGDTLSVSDIRLIPTVNIFDSASFVAPGQ